MFPGTPNQLFPECDWSVFCCLSNGDVHVGDAGVMSSVTSCFTDSSVASVHSDKPVRSMVTCFTDCLSLLLSNRDSSLVVL